MSRRTYVVFETVISHYSCKVLASSENEAIAHATAGRKSKGVARVKRSLDDKSSMLRIEPTMGESGT